MKNQYFGDTRDLFKYDLILRVMEGIPSIRSLTFIPMLTPDDESTHGNRTDHRRAKAGFKNRPLVEHLAACVLEGRRNVCEILPLFTAHGIQVNLHGEPFSTPDRAAYFRAIPDGWLREALVFLDPDIGMEVADPTEKHLLFTEIGNLLGRMEGNSVLMIFQFYPRVERGAYTMRRKAELGRIHRGEILSITDNQIVFFFLASDPGLMERIGDLLAGYRNDYPVLTLDRGRKTPT
jgi:hypothetical protein